MQGSVMVRAGALNVTRHGLGTGRSDAVRSLVEKVRLTEIEPDRRRITPDDLARRAKER